VRSRLIVQTALSFAVTALLLFVPAGTVKWLAGWVFLIALHGCGLAMELTLAKCDPALLEERLSSPIQREQEGWDKILLPLALLLFVVWLPLIALDSVRYHYSHVPLWLRCVGLLGLLSSISLVYLAFRENTYASPVVKIQKERGQSVVTTGPYRYVRHPMYAGALIFFLSTPLLLGSWWGLALAPALMLVFAVRALMEERTLSAKLDGYAEYAARVRYRLIPLIW
jgi:protein-S-isoprenylcysteine O-methyltransferase Ste14